MKYFLVITKIVDRYFFDVVNTFASGGEVMVYNSENIKYLDKYGNYIQYINNVSYLSIFPKVANKMVLVTDDHNLIEQQGKLFKSTIFINYNYYGDTSNGIKKPYGMHPNIYKNKQHIRKSINIKHDIAIGFAGNVSKEHYTSPIISNIFKIPNRYETFQFLSNNLNGLYEGDLKLNILPKNGGSLVLLDKNKLSIEDEKWLDFVRRCRFFIPLAGVTMPMCHNLIEAIYCGSIPIIHENQNIGLINGESCLTYTTLKELEEIIYNILDGDYDDMWQVMFNEVVNYYSTNLEYNSFMTTIEEMSNFILYVNAEQTSIREMISI